MLLLNVVRSRYSRAVIHDIHCMTDTQVCVQPRLSTVNVTLAHLLLSAVLQAPLLLSTGACSWYTTLRRQLSIDISCPQDAQQQTRRPPLLLPIDGTDRRSDRQTDARPFHRPCSHTMRAVSKMHIATLFVLRQCRHCCWIVLCLNLMGQLSCLAKVL